MTDDRDKLSHIYSKKSKSNSECSQEEIEQSEKLEENKVEKTRLKFKKEDMYEIKYNF